MKNNARDKMLETVVRYNFTLSTDDGRVASWIARQLEERWGSGRIWARGIVREPVQEARVLTKIRDIQTVPLTEVLEIVRAAGRRFNVDVVEADLVGDVPLEVILAAAERALMVSRIRPGQISWEGT